MSPPARQFLVFIVFNVLCWQSLIGTTLVLHARALGIDAAWIGVLSALQPFTMILALFLFLRQQPALWRFACVSVAGVAVGLYSVRFLRRVPGGAPHPGAARAAHASYRELALVVRDGAFRRFVLWTSVGIMVSAGQALLLTLYLRDFLGMSPGAILLLNACASALIALTINRWAHVADRLGSPRTMAAAALMLAAALLVLAAAHPHRGTTWLVVPLCMVIMIAEAGFFVAANRGFLHRAKEGLRHGCSAVWIAGTSLSAGVTTVAVGLWLNGGAGWMYWICSAVLGAVMAGVAVACVRMASVAAPPTEHHHQLFDPTRPYLSLLWMCGFVLDPTRPLDDE